MKLIAIGDTHGRTTWKKIVEKEAEADKIIFIGDYLDSREGVSTETQIQNFKEILEFKKKNTDQVVLLIGNHDYHYLPGPVENDIRYSQWNPALIGEVTPILEKETKEGTIQACYVYDNIIFTHAGLSQTWCKNNHVDMDNLEEFVNNYFLHNTEKFGFQLDPDEDRGWCSPYGDNDFQSPLWIRPRSLITDRLPGYTQVVGHTQITDFDMGLPIKLIDILGTKEAYLEIEDGEFKTKEL